MELENEQNTTQQHVPNLRDLALRTVAIHLPQLGKTKNLEYILNEELIFLLFQFLQTENLLTEDRFAAILCPNLKDIKLLFCKNNSLKPHSFYTVGDIVPDLRRFEVPIHHTIDERGIGNILSKCRKLEVLKLRGLSDLHDITIKSEFGDLLNYEQDYHQWRSAIRSNQHNNSTVKFLCTELKELDLLGCKRVQEESLCELSDTCFSKLLKLSLKGCIHLSSKTLSHMITNTSQLRKLSLADCDNATDQVLQTIAESCPFLINLNLNWCSEVSDAGIISICKGCSHLESLKLRNLQSISDDALHVIVDKYADQLRVLDITAVHNLTLEPISILADRCHKLHKLSLSFLDFTNNRTVKTILENCSDLTTLNLEGCKQLSFEALECLALPLIEDDEQNSAPLCAGTLQLIDLSYCDNMTARVLQAIADEHPNIHLMDYYGALITSRNKIDEIIK